MFSLLCPDYGSLALAPLKRSQDAEIRLSHDELG